MKTPNLPTTLRILVVLYLTIFTFNFAVDYQSKYAMPYSRPTREEIDEMQWVRRVKDTYSHMSIIVVVREHSKYLWMLAWVGGSIYFGNLVYLFTNRVEEQLLNSSDQVTRNDYIGTRQLLWINKVLEGNFDPNEYTIVVTQHTYRPDIIELQFLETVHKGIYVVKKMNRTEAEKWFNIWTEYKPSEPD